MDLEKPPITPAKFFGQDLDVVRLITRLAIDSLEQWTSENFFSPPL
jgi:hypothetical protein